MSGRGKGTLVLSQKEGDITDLFIDDELIVSSETRTIRGNKVTVVWVADKEIRIVRRKRTRTLAKFVKERTQRGPAE